MYYNSKTRMYYDDRRRDTMHVTQTIPAPQGLCAEYNNGRGGTRLMPVAFIALEESMSGYTQIPKEYILNPSTGEYGRARDFYGFRRFVYINELLTQNGDLDALKRGRSAKR